MRILAVGAHPDDLDILCAGTLAKFAKRGDEIFMGILTDGSKGHFRTPPAELAEIRKSEATESSEVIGAELIWLGMPDACLFDDERTRLRVIDMMRIAKPDLIMTHSPNDYHPDHRMASKLVFDATYIATVPHMKTEHSHYEAVAPIYYMDTPAGFDFQPEVYVNITDTIDKKKEMMSKHQSQVQWLKEHDNIDILDFIDITAKFRGLQCGAMYAEGFRLKRGWLGISKERLLP